MPFDRVIQDSDDEGEPPGELSPEKTNRVPVTNYDGPKSLGAQEVNHDSHIGVNFDQFLQSQDAPSIMLSSSQQQREERWIPVTGRVGSMGTMMTEIGLAQQRLFDDGQQAQYANQPMAFHEPGLVPSHGQYLNSEMAGQEKAAPVHDYSIARGQDSIPYPELHVIAPSDDWSQSAPSYNIFDSFSHTPTGQLNRADFIRDIGNTTQSEPMQNFELRRWASMQGASSSPQDTEPFSSVISPKVARAKSDNIPPNIVPPSPASLDELALPVTTEMPKIEKRGRKKKQVLPANDEDDEISHAQAREPAPSKPEKRRPGRPPKHAKVPLDDGINTGDIEFFDPDHPAGETQDGLAKQGPSIEVPEHYDIPQIVLENPESNGQSAPPAQEKEAQLSPKPTKEPKKKKLKRGKTTSVTLTKTFESDIEDDVIWIDERPVIPATLKDNPIPNPAETKDNIPLEPAPAPKKRGRKRKKTAEQLNQEAAAPEADTQAVIPQEGTNPRNESGISVVLNNITRTRTPDTTNIIPETNTITEDSSISYAPPKETPQPTSPTKPSNHESEEQPPETPQKTTDPTTPSTKGPGKHSPISSTSKVPYRVGLSKKARIAPLLRIIKR
ncbi:hypothetical protein BDW59DRAFT_18353 [Aspergillus cavernicola]|uniref:Altered inheritance of mitochondria protein 21 n=1 Tax=Aspergillus cavernicola TaxID=176166 RepID=A0ABR4IRY4_9EURO